jgi:putative RecB family exonuclease
VQPSEQRVPEHTSASQLSCYAQCPKKYWFRYIAKAKSETKGDGLILGSAVHSALGWWFDERHLGREPSKLDVRAILRADMHACHPVGEGGSLDRLVTEGFSMVEAFLAHGGDFDVVQTEAPMSLTIVDPASGEVMPRQLIGYLDFCTADGNVIELKTARAAYSRIAIVTNLPFAAYCAALDLAGGSGRLGLVALIRTKKPRVQVETILPSRNRTHWFMSVACALERAIAAGVYPPTPSAMNCGACEFKGRCLGLNSTPNIAEGAEAA